MRAVKCSLKKEVIKMETKVVVTMVGLAASLSSIMFALLAFKRSEKQEHKTEGKSVRRNRNTMPRSFVHGQRKPIRPYSYYSRA